MEEQVDQESLVIQLRNAFLQQNLEPFDSRDISKIRNEDRAVLAYLLNSHYNLEKAYNMMTESLKWRKSFGVNDLSKDSFNEELLNDPYLYFKGYGKNGMPLLIWDMKRHKKGNGNSAIKQYFTFMLEHREGAKDYQKVIMLFNMSGCGLSNIDYDFIKYLISLLTEYYPDILDNLLVFEMPRLLSAAWTIIKNMLDEDSRDAIKFVNKSEVLEYVDKEQLPISLGGSNDSDVTSVMELDTGEVLDKKQVTFTKEEPSTRKTSDSSASAAKSDRMQQILTITPQDTMMFTVQQSNSESLPQTIRMSNTMDVQVAYKVKTTAPEHYRVKPTVGVIEAGQTVEVSVQLTPGSAVTASRDRFLVQSTPVNTDTYRGDITEYWRTVEPSKVNEHRLRCRVTMDGSPIEEKVDHIGNPTSILNHTSAYSSTSDRNLDIENRLRIMEHKVDTIHRMAASTLTIIRIFLAIVVIYTLFIIHQEYMFLQESQAVEQERNSEL